jgi:hypothetical protein
VHCLMEERGNPRVPGTFIATFAFSIMVLGSIDSGLHSDEVIANVCTGMGCMAIAPLYNHFLVLVH